MLAGGRILKLYESSLKCNAKGGGAAKKEQ
jgi:hypothetical protein